MIAKPCAHPGCVSFAEPQSSRCAKHRTDYDRTVRSANPALARAAKIRSSHKWQVTRGAFRSTYPLCCDPFKLHTLGPEPTDPIHHVLPLVTHPELAFDWVNLRPLCVPCHTKVEAMERIGETTQHLFP